jgi:hypothetical protein
VLCRSTGLSGPHDPAVDDPLSVGIFEAADVPGAAPSSGRARDCNPLANAPKALDPV